MKTLPSIELLESTHQFPGRFLLKVIGRAEDGFVARVVAAVREQMELESDPPFRVRGTSAGRHVAITLEPHFQSAWEVLAVYGRIGELAGVTILL